MNRQEWNFYDINEIKDKIENNGNNYTNGINSTRTPLTSMTTSMIRTKSSMKVENSI